MAQKFLNTGASAWEEKTRIYFLTKLSKWETKLCWKKKKQETIGGPFAINNPKVSASILENQIAAIRAQLHEVF